MYIVDLFVTDILHTQSQYIVYAYMYIFHMMVSNMWQIYLHVYI